MIFAVFDPWLLNCSFYHLSRWLQW